MLYIPIPQPPEGKSYTSHSFSFPPSAGLNVILNLPGLSTTKSVALYWDTRTKEVHLHLYFIEFQNACRLFNGGVRHYLIPKRVPADGDRLRPTRNQAGDVLADDWLAEHGAAQDVSDGSVWALPHALQLKLWGRREHPAGTLTCPCLWTSATTCITNYTKVTIQTDRKIFL